MTGNIDIYDIKQRNEDILLDINGVVSVGVDEANERIIVGHNLTRSEAAKKIPSHADGIEIDAERIGEITPEDMFEPLPTDPDEISTQLVDGRLKQFRPVPGGVACGHTDGGTGTTGFLLDDGESQYLASNNHVMAVSNAADAGDPIYQPNSGTADDEIGQLADYVPITDGATVDLAWCSNETSSVEYINTIVDAERPRGEAYSPSVGDVLTCSGIATGTTSGEVTQTDVTINVSYSGEGSARLKGMVFTESMSTNGDSGSPVLYNKQPAGMVFAGNENITVLMTAESIEQATGMEIVTGDSTDEEEDEAEEDEPIVPTLGEQTRVFRARANPDSRYEEGVVDADTYDLIVANGFGITSTARVDAAHLDTASVYSNQNSEELTLAQAQRQAVIDFFTDAAEKTDGEWPLYIRVVRTNDERHREVEVYNSNEQSLAAVLSQTFAGEELLDTKSAESVRERFEALSEEL